MKGKVFAVILVSILVLAGCETTGPKTKTGAVAGGVLGAVAGGVIGHQSGHGFEGAAIGGLVGALSGGLIGSEMDKKALSTNPNHVTIMKVAEMGNQGVPDAVIISEIDRTHSVYELNSEIITYLKQNKVGDRVIDYMLGTAG